MTEAKRLSFGEYADRILIAAVGAIFIWLGTRVENLSAKVETLIATNAAYAVALERTQKEQDRLRADFDEHQREDRVRFTSIGKLKGGS